MLNIHKFYTKAGILGIISLAGLFATSISIYANDNNTSGQRMLIIELPPALCRLSEPRKKLRQCLEGYSLTVAGLDLGYKRTCNSIEPPYLSPLQLKVVSRVMPDESLRDQAWQNYGACSPYNATNYFRQITSLSSQLKLPRELNSSNSYTVSKSRFLLQMIESNKGLTPSGIDLMCQDGKRKQSILTQIRICYSGDGFGKCLTQTNSCGENFIIMGRG